ncbi:hypothetical protein N431DRAFT_488968 [Stipitochalara longipes BDJ]|nr:hypothetical protein N431DRAFT_488968 [Stipitochalara longipes BDJ]
MAAKLITILSALSTFTSASFLIPRGVDGIYLLEDGKENATFHSEITAEMRNFAPAPSLNNFSKRDSLPSGTTTTCSGEIFERSDWNAVYNVMLSVCAFGEGEYFYGRGIGVVANGIITYMCNYSHQGGNPCNNQEYSDAGNRLINACFNQDGEQEGGWVSIPSWQKTYGYQSGDDNVC